MKYKIHPNTLLMIFTIFNHDVKTVVMEDNFKIPTFDKANNQKIPR